MNTIPHNYALVVDTDEILVIAYSFGVVDFSPFAVELCQSVSQYHNGSVLPSTRTGTRGGVSKKCGDEETLFQCHYSSSKCSGLKV